MSKSEEAIAELEKVTEGLLYPSESDEPFQTFCWTRAGNESAEAAVLRHYSGPSERISTDEFFEFLAEADDAERFQQLHDVISRLVMEPVVMRIGKINISIFLIGKQDRNWIGVQTRSVET